MSRKSKQEYFLVMYERYHQAAAKHKSHLLDEICRVCHWHRKHAIRKLNKPLSTARKRRRPPRGLTYSAAMLSILIAVWKAAGYPWSVRLKALVPVWLPWIRQHYRLTPALE